MAVPVSSALQEPGDAIAGAPPGGGAQGTILGIAPVEGAEFNGAVARFQNVAHLGAAPPAATIDWDDGFVTPGTVTPGPATGEYLVSGRHTYVHAETANVSVTLSWENDGVINTVASGTVQVKDAPLTAIPITFRPALGAPF